MSKYYVARLFPGEGSEQPEVTIAGVSDISSAVDPEGVSAEGARLAVRPPAGTVKLADRSLAGTDKQAVRPLAGSAKLAVRPLAVNSFLPVRAYRARV